MKTHTAVEWLSDNLAMFRDTCNVFVVKDGSRALLVDFGSGQILNPLRSLGMRRVDWVLHTHHHRDQCQGDRLLPDETKIAVPFHERPLFEDAENFWRNKQIYDSYNDQSTCFTLTSSIRVDRALEDYEYFEWRSHQFFVLPALGHTHGSIALLADVDGRKVAFTGDMIYLPGKLWNLYDFQHSYGGAEGIDLNLFSLRDLKRMQPDLILPSHGDPMANPDESITVTMDNLRQYHLYMTGQPPTIDRKFKRLSPHLLTAPHGCCTFYVLLSDSGKAMLIDYGAASGNHFYAHVRQFESWEKQRFVEHSIHELKADWGVKSVEVVIPTHYHDDHTCGIPHLQKHHGVKLWALDLMANILDNPHEYNVPCLLPYPMRVDRRIKDGETVNWEEYELKVVHFPGQTEYHMAMAVTVDGQRVAFIGDSIWDAGTALSQPIIHRNVVTAASHRKCAEKMEELQPQILAGGHGSWIPVDRRKLHTLHDRAQSTREMFDRLLPEPSEMGVNPRWIAIVPYQMAARTGGTARVGVEIQNYRARSIVAKASLALPQGWTSTPRSASVRIEPGARASMGFKVKVGKSRNRRVAIAADVTLDSTHLGQIAEAVVNLV